MKYEFGGIFDENVKISLWGYNIETVMAEKVETILSRGVFTTRPRDFYDVFILGTTQKYDKEVFREALKATAIHRGSLEKIADVKGISDSAGSLSGTASENHHINTGSVNSKKDGKSADFRHISYTSGMRFFSKKGAIYGILYVDNKSRENTRWSRFLQKNN